MLLYGQEVAVEVDLDNTVAAILKPGQVSVHHTMTVHSSEPNNGRWPFSLIMEIN